jgi:hypothetical protein
MSPTMRTALACDAGVSRIGRLAPLARRLASALAALALAAAAFFCSLPAAAAPFDLKGEDWEGLSQFLHTAEAELGGSRTAPTSTLDLHRLTPADALVLVHPTRELDVDELSSFMRAGGRIVLLDDYGTGDELLAKFNIRRRPLPARPAEMLRGNPALAIAEPAVEHPAVHDVSQVVTNHATGVEQPALSPILVVRGDGEDDVLLAVAGVVGRGRLLAIGDASVVINSMLRYPGNRALALALIRYALEDETWGKRSGKLYVLANDFEMTGSFGDESLLAGAASEARRALFDSLDTLRRVGMNPVVSYVVALAVGIGIIVWTGVRAGKTHKHTAPRFTRTVPVVAQGGIAGHAAVLGSPGAPRALAILELKSALEEELATRLGLERAPPADQLVARLRAARLIDESGARALSRLLSTMARAESKLGGRAGGPSLLRDRPSDADVLAVATELRDVRQRLGLRPEAARPAPAPPGEDASRRRA